MSGKTPADPLELLQISREFLAGQQKFLPTPHLYAQVAEAMRAVTQANITYVQSLMRVQALLLAALVERPGNGRGKAEEKPSAAAHRPDSSTP